MYLFAMFFFYGLILVQEQILYSINFVSLGFRIFGLTAAGEPGCQNLGHLYLFVYFVLNFKSKVHMT